MEYNKLKSEVEATVKRLADNYFEDMQCNPQEYADFYWVRDEDDCWEEAIDMAKEDMIQDPKNWIDEDVQDEMEEQDWYFVREIVDDITWRTYNNLEVERCFA
jgi:hypothetical protein